MPELPEVQTTVNGLNKYVKNLTIKDVWTDFHSPLLMFKETIKNPEYFKEFKKIVTGAKIVKAERRAKNILINLDNGYTILIHLKMTGHLLYGAYTMEHGAHKKIQWKPREKNSPLSDPFNRFVHLVFTLSNGKHLALCDARKFSKTVLLETKTAHITKHLEGIGPEPLEEKFTWKDLKVRLLSKKSGKIKTVLMDPSVVAGIGNIYSDEALWLSNIHPERLSKDISNKEMQKLFKSIQEVLTKGIDFGGDSMSDYRNILGLPGKFHHEQNVYQKKNDRCGKKGCRGVITRIVVGGRSTHFCPEHQV